jgi:hypothetical protein
MNTKLLLIFMVGFLGGITGALLVTSSTVQAELRKAAYNEINLYNNEGKRTAFFGSGTIGQGTMWLYDNQGQARIQIGTYEAPAEAGQPVIGLQDNSANLRAIWRLHGKKDSPVLVLKDISGDDRIVMGLRGDSETPYLEYTNDQGRKINLLK